MIRLFRVSIPTSVLVLILVEFVLIYACLLAAAWYFLADELEIFLLYDRGIERLGIVVVTMMLTFYFQDGYNDFGVRSKVILLQNCVFALGVSILIQAMVAYLFPRLDCAPLGTVFRRPAAVSDIPFLARCVPAVFPVGVGRSIGTVSGSKLACEGHRRPS